MYYEIGRRTRYTPIAATGVQCHQFNEASGCRRAAVWSQLALSKQLQESSFTFRS